MLLVRPPSNLADQPPFKSEHRAGFGDDQLAKFDSLVSDAKLRMKQQPVFAIPILERARDLDPEFAAVRYQLARLYEVTGRYQDARAEFVAAREHDICPLRMLTPMEDAMLIAARDFNVPLLDAHSLLEQRTKHGILDGSQLIDHVHPSFEGHQQIALSITEHLAEMGLVRLKSDWQTTAKQSFSTHFNALPDFYFADGQRNLDNLLYWTRGEADGPDIKTRGAAEPQPK